MANARAQSPVEGWDSRPTQHSPTCQQYTALDEPHGRIYQGIEIPIAEATALRKNLWLTILNCGSVSEANSQKQINKTKLTSIYWQFQRCGSDVMYLTDTRLTQVQGQRALEFMRILLPHGTFLRQSAVGKPNAPKGNTQKQH
jgi:hypothetical protein